MKLLRIMRAMWARGPLELASFMGDWSAGVRWHFLYAALDTGLLEALRTPASKADLMLELKVERPELLGALLDLGVALRELSQRGARYQVTGRRARALVGPNGGMYSGLVEAQVTYYNSVYRQLNGRMRGEPLGDYLSTIGDLVARYAELAEPYTREEVAELIAGAGQVRVLDVGCGSGVYLRAAAEANPQATGIGLEIDEAVADKARRNLTRWGVADRFKVLVGDIRQPPAGLEGPFDLIGLFNLIYYFELEERPTLLRDLCGRLTDGGTLLLVTNVQAGGRDVASANLDLATGSMIGCTPLPELEVLLEQLRESGFGRSEAKRLIPRSEVYVVRAGR